MRKLLVLLIFLGSSPSGTALDIDALAFNIRFDNPKDGENAWPKRKDMVGKWLKAQSPDIVGLQEAKRHQIDDIRKRTSIYAEYGVGRDDGKRAGEHCTILYLKKRFILDKKDSGTFWLSDTPEKIASKSWGNEIPRICTWARLIEKDSDRAFYVYNIHWDHQSQPSRVRAAQLIIQRIAKRKNPRDPIILMGDFNASETNPAIKALKGDPLKLIDTYREVKPNEEFVRTFHGFRGGSFAGGKIDHVFVLPGTSSVKSAAIVRYNEKGRYLSDHYPVRAQISFQPNVISDP